MNCWCYLRFCAYDAGNVLLCAFIGAHIAESIVGVALHADDLGDRICGDLCLFEQPGFSVIQRGTLER